MTRTPPRGPRHRRSRRERRGRASRPGQFCNHHSWRQPVCGPVQGCIQLFATKNRAAAVL